MLSVLLEIATIDQTSTSGQLNRVTVNIKVSDDSPASAIQYSYATISWGDGQTEEVKITGQQPTYSENHYWYIGNYSQTLSHSYPTGNYNVVLTATNRNFPTPETQSALVAVKLADSVSSSVTTYLSGPILPADSGYPNASQWNLSVGKNLEVLASSVKMILSTAVGERLMEPTYGSNLSQFIFGPNDSVTLDSVRSEVTRAITTWETRVSVRDVTYSAKDKVAVVTVVLVSNLTNELLTVNATVQA